VVEAEPGPGKPGGRSAGILAAVDSDAIAPAVLEAGRSLARVFQAELEAVHIGGEGIATIQALARTANVPLRLLPGSSVDSLADALDAEDVLLGVLGSRASPGGRRPVGSTAFAAIHKVSRPLVVVSPDLAPDQTTRLQRVLVPLDGSDATAEAIQKMARRLCASSVKVTVLHVFDKEHVPQFMDHMPEALETWNTEFLERYFEECEVGLETRAGEPPEAVLEVAATERADMIVLSWGQDLSQDRANLVREVLTSASVPVMLVPLKPGVPRDVLEPSG
jgi:nucleotide-binding universal stress UspA family protein